VTLKQLVESPGWKLTGAILDALATISFFAYFVLAMRTNVDSGVWITWGFTLGMGACSCGISYWRGRATGERILSHRISDWVESSFAIFRIDGCWIAKLESGRKTLMRAGTHVFFDSDVTDIETAALKDLTPGDDVIVQVLVTQKRGGS
jgi:hypothetical protein